MSKNHQHQKHLHQKHLLKKYNNKSVILTEVALKITVSVFDAYIRGAELVDIDCQELLSRVMHATELPDLIAKESKSYTPKVEPMNSSDHLMTLSLVNIYGRVKIMKLKNMRKNIKTIAAKIICFLNDRVYEEKTIKEFHYSDFNNIK